MQIRLDTIVDEPLVWTEKETLDAAELAAVELLSLGEIAWSGSVERVPPGYRLQASIAYRQTIACGRCLEPHEQDVAVDLELMVIVGSRAPIAGEFELESSDLVVLEIDNCILDTGPLLIEQVELNVPMSVLCKPDCQGLCPHCGADRNQKPDCCEGGEIDPRWQALADLKKG